MMIGISGMSDGRVMDREPAVRMLAGRLIRRVELRHVMREQRA